MKEKETKICCEERLIEKSCSDLCVKKHKIFAILTICVIATLVIIFIRTFDKDNMDTISVVGQGIIPVRPDGVLINFGVITIKEKTPEDAIKNTSEKIAAINVALVGAGIPLENQTITGYVLNPIFSQGEMINASIEGYTASQQITVRISNMKDKTLVDEIISIATKAGANQVGEIKFISSNIEKLKEQARLMALIDAKEKAKEMEKVAEVRLGKMVGWYENGIVVPGQSYSDPYTPQLQSNNNSSVPSGYTVLQPGQLDVIIQLSVNYRIE